MLLTIHPDKVSSAGRKLLARCRAIVAAGGDASRFYASLTAKELDALIKAIDDAMGPERFREYCALRPDAVLTEDDQRLWDTAIAASGEPSKVIPLSRDHTRREP